MKPPAQRLVLPTMLVLLGLLPAACSDPSSKALDASIIHIPGEADQDRPPVVVWDHDSLDLGILAAGELALAQYTLTNTGHAPLVISQIVPSCGCTVVRSEQAAPIAPGEQRTIVLEFDAGDRIGTVLESATVVTNAVPSSSILEFTARVLGPGSDITP